MVALTPPQTAVSTFFFMIIKAKQLFRAITTLVGAIIIAWLTSFTFYFVTSYLARTQVIP